MFRLEEYLSRNGSFAQALISKRCFSGAQPKAGGDIKMKCLPSTVKNMRRAAMRVIGLSLVAIAVGKLTPALAQGDTYVCLYENTNFQNGYAVGDVVSLSAPSKLDAEKLVSSYLVKSFGPDSASHLSLSGLGVPHCILKSDATIKNIDPLVHN